MTHTAYKLTEDQAQIVSRILKQVFDAEVEANAIAHITTDGTTVVVITPHALYSIGHDYFRELVQQFKSAHDPEGDYDQSRDSEAVSEDPVVFVLSLEANLERHFNSNLMDREEVKVTLIRVRQMRDSEALLRSADRIHKVFPPGNPVRLSAGRKAGQDIAPPSVNFCIIQISALINEV